MVNGEQEGKAKVIIAMKGSRESDADWEKVRGKGRATRHGRVRARAGHERGCRVLGNVG